MNVLNVGTIRNGVLPALYLPTAKQQAVQELLIDYLSSGQGRIEDGSWEKM